MAALISAWMSIVGPSPEVPSSLSSSCPSSALAEAALAMITSPSSSSSLSGLARALSSWGAAAGEDCRSEGPGGEAACAGPDAPAAGPDPGEWLVCASATGSSPVLAPVALAPFRALGSDWDEASSIQAALCFKQERAFYTHQLRSLGDQANQLPATA